MFTEKCSSTRGGTAGAALSLAHMGVPACPVLSFPERRRLRSRQRAFFALGWRERGVRSAQKMALEFLGRPKIYQLAHASQQECIHQRLKLAQLLGQLGAFLTLPLPPRPPPTMHSPAAAANCVPRGATSRTALRSTCTAFRPACYIRAWKRNVSLDKLPSQFCSTSTLDINNTAKQPPPQPPGAPPHAPPHAPRCLVIRPQAICFEGDTAIGNYHHLASKKILRI
jgi:hypothetical protein